MTKEVQRSKPKYWAVVPAAGSGRRMNVDIPKQYLELQGKLLIEHTLERLINFLPLEKIVVVLGKETAHKRSLTIFQHEKVLLAEGGAERYHSVLNGIKAIESQASDDDWVLVHDAARPCIRQADLEWLVKCVNNHAVGGVLGTVVKDTMKRTDINGAIIETVNRSGLWHAFTPQMFRYGLLVRALARAVLDDVPVTDEASAMEYAGYQPIMIEGHSDNIKVTTGVDFALASLYLEQQSKLIENE